MPEFGLSWERGKFGPWAWLRKAAKMALKDRGDFERISIISLITRQIKGKELVSGRPADVGTVLATSGDHSFVYLPKLY